MHGSIAGMVSLNPLFGSVGTLALSSTKFALAVTISWRDSQVIPIFRCATKVSFLSSNIETLHVTTPETARHPGGNIEKLVSLSKVMLIPGSGEISRRSIVTFHLASKAAES